MLSRVLRQSVKAPVAAFTTDARRVKVAREALAQGAIVTDAEPQPFMWKGYQDKGYNPDLGVAEAERHYGDEVHQTQVRQATGRDIAPELYSEVDGREITTLGGIIGKYGVYPFLGLASAIAITKEIVIIDDHMLSYVAVPALIAAAYLGIGDSFWKLYVDSVKADRKWWNEFNQLQYELVQSELQAFATKVETPAVLAQAREEFNEAAKNLYAFQTYQLKVQARDAVVKKLEGIQHREKEQRAQLKEKLIAAATKYVRTQVAKSSAEDRQTFLEMALAKLEGKRVIFDSAADHPVQKHLYSFLKQAKKSQAVVLASLKKAQKKATKQ